MGFKYFASGGGGVLSAPVITGITSDAGDSSSDGITNDQTLTISGTAANDATVNVLKDGVSIGTATANGSGAWSFNYTGTTLSAGTYAFTATAYTPSVASATYTVVVDITAPTAAITYSVAGPYKSGATATITATFNSPMASNVTPKIAISGSNTVAATNMTRVSSTVYTYAYTAASGNGTATVALSIGTDIAGNVVTSAPTSGSTFTVDNTAPTVIITSSAGSSGGSTGTSPIPFTFTWAEAVTLFVVGDITVGNGTAGNFSGSGTTYTADITPTADGAVTIDVASGVCIDAAGNTNSAATQFTITYSSNPFSGLSSNNWLEQVSSSRIYSKGLSGDPAVSDGTGGTTASPLTSGQWTTVKSSGGTNADKHKLIAWCGGAWDEANKRLWCFGTGHSDGRGNGLVYYSPSTELWSLVLWPDHAPWTSTSDPTNTQTTNPDGGPVARHTSNSMVVVGSYLYVSGYACGDNAASPSRVWRFPLNGTSHAQWELAPTTGIDITEQTSFPILIYDPTSGLICCINNQVFATIDPNNFSAGFTERLDNTFTAFWNWNGEQYMSAALDVSRSKILAIGRNQTSVFNISNLASISVVNNTAWTGDFADIIGTSYSYMGITYDSVDAVVVVWKGGSDRYTVNMSSLAITKVASSGGSTPSAMTANGLYNRFCHSAAWDTYICVNDENACDYLKG